jgi:hypothetical protein
MTVMRGDRQRAIKRVQRRLLRGGKPRIFVSFLLILTGAAGFFISSALLHLGVTMMAVRYPLAVLLAYAVFLLLLRLWLACQRKSGGFNWIFDFPDSTPHLSVSNSNFPDKAIFSGGSDFGGAGAGGNWGGNTSAAGSKSSLDLNFDLDFGEGCFLFVLPVIAVAGALMVMFYIVYVAPVFLAEILVDAFLVAGLYKRIQGLEPRHWLRSVVRRTLLPVMLATSLFIVAGYLMQRAVPAAKSIGDFWQQLDAQERER